MARVRLPARLGAHVEVRISVASAFSENARERIFVVAGDELGGISKQRNAVAKADKADKRLKKLSRVDLLELLIEQSKEMERLAAELEASEAARNELVRRNVELEQKFEHNCAGFDEVSDRAVRHVMSGASQAVEEIVAKNQLRADAILAEARSQAETIVSEANDEAAVIRKYTKMLLTDAKEEATRTKSTARTSSDDLMAETRRICADLIQQAQAEIDALFDDADARVLGDAR